MKFKEKIKGNNLKYETNKYVYDFQQFQMVRPFGDSIFRVQIKLGQAEEDQNNLL